VAKRFDRLHGRISGRPGHTLILGHGFGCDQTAWSKLLPWLEAHFRVVAFDFAGCGPAGEENYDRRRHGTLFGYADDVLEILDELRIERCAYLGHSVGSMIGAAVAVARPGTIEKLVMVAGSPHYLNSQGYEGGFEQAELDALYDGMSTNFQAWAAGFVPMVVGIPDHAVIDEFSRMLFQMRPDIAQAMARVIFQSDMRGLLPRLAPPTCIVQPRRDIAVPMSVAEFMQQRIRNAALEVIESEGHVPHITEPEAVRAVLERHLTPLRVAG
jgi:sigma-B regulation protein RsbQ